MHMVNIINELTFLAAYASSTAVGCGAHWSSKTLEQCLISVHTIQDILFKDVICRTVSPLQFGSLQVGN